jgi:hypothetical protein
VLGVKTIHIIYTLTLGLLPFFLWFLGVLLLHLGGIGVGHDVALK